MNHQFDELAKGLAQSVTRRGALKKFGLGLAGMALAALGFARTAEAEPGHGPLNCNHCLLPYYGCDPNDGVCLEHCVKKCGHSH